MNTIKILIAELNSYFKNSSSNAVIITIAIGLSIASEWSGIMGSIMNAAVWVILAFVIVDKFNIRQRDWFPGDKSNGNGKGKQAKPNTNTNQQQTNNSSGSKANFTST